MRFKLVNMISGRTAARRQDVEGVPRELSVLDQLEQYIGQSPGGGLPYFFHATKSDKIGVNPQQNYISTPLGVYFYPIIEETWLDLKHNRKYRMDENANIFVAQARNPAKVLVLSKDSANSDNPTGLYARLKDEAVKTNVSGGEIHHFYKPRSQYSVREKAYAENQGEWESIAQPHIVYADPLVLGLSKLDALAIEAPKGTPEFIVRTFMRVGIDLENVNVFLKAVKKVLWWGADESVKKLLSADPKAVVDAFQMLRYGKPEFTKKEFLPVNRAIVKFSTDLLRAGYEGVYDPGFGIIHKNEPAQAVFFGSRYYTVVTKLRNKPQQPAQATALIQMIAKYGSAISKTTDLTQQLQALVAWLAELTDVLPEGLSGQEIAEKLLKLAVPPVSLDVWARQVVARLNGTDRVDSPRTLAIWQADPSALRETLRGMASTVDVKPVIKKLLQELRYAKKQVQSLKDSIIDTLVFYLPSKLHQKQYQGLIKPFTGVLDRIYDQLDALQTALEHHAFEVADSTRNHP